jgi:hypothetical protein
LPITFEPLHDALAAVIEEAGGLVAARLIAVAEAPAMLTADIGERDLADLSGVAELLEASRLLSRQRAPRCLVCARPFGSKRRPFIVLILRANSEAAKAGFALGVCERCGVAAGGMTGLWRQILPLLRCAQPDLEDISERISSIAGHA